MDMSAYQEAAQRTSRYPQTSRDKLVNGGLGLCGESGEVADAIKKHLYQGHPLDRGEILEELGDVLWYVVETAAAIGASLDDVAHGNIDKLLRRYPVGFRVQDSVERGKDKEAL